MKGVRYDYAIMKHTRALRRAGRSHIGSQGPNPDEECVRRESSTHCGISALSCCRRGLALKYLAISIWAPKHFYIIAICWLENACGNSCEDISLRSIIFIKLWQRKYLWNLRAFIQGCALTTLREDCKIETGWQCWELAYLHINNVKWFKNFQISVGD